MADVTKAVTAAQQSFEQTKAPIEITNFTVRRRKNDDDTVCLEIKLKDTQSLPLPPVKA